MKMEKTMKGEQLIERGREEKKKEEREKWI